MSKVKCLWKSQFTQCYGLCSIQSRAICGVLGTSSGENGEVVDARLDQSILWAGHSGNWGCCKFSSQGCNYLKGFNYPSSVCPPPNVYLLLCCGDFLETEWITLGADTRLKGVVGKRSQRTIVVVVSILTEFEQILVERRFMLMKHKYIFFDTTQNYWSRLRPPKLSFL